MDITPVRTSQVGCQTGVQVGILASMRHPNIVLFMGVCLEPPCLVTEWCARGSLFDVLAKAARNPTVASQLEWPRRLTMALDGAKVGSLHDLTCWSCSVFVYTFSWAPWRVPCTSPCCCGHVSSPSEFMPDYVPVSCQPPSCLFPVPSLLRFRPHVHSILCSFCPSPFTSLITACHALFLPVTPFLLHQCIYSLLSSKRIPRTGEGMPWREAGAPGWSWPE
jgi:hypothetical protein